MSVPISYSMSGAAEATGLSKSYLDRAIRSGELRAKRSSVMDDGTPTGNRVILHADLMKFAESLVDA